MYIDTMRDPQKEYFYAVSVVNDLGRKVKELMIIQKMRI